jgi:glyoxylase-like metal-dependent hydrolase (beta-lactamase superfamily II)
VRVLRPAENVYAFYAGRDGERHDAASRNWVDLGALSLGIASYAIVDGDHALVYDTHVSVAHARLVRAALDAEGVRTFTVVLSHWHLDHVAGTAAFPDAVEVVACARTAEILREHRGAIEAGTLEGPPAIDPLVLPTRTFTDRVTLAVGALRVELLQVDVHSDDGVVVWWPERRLLFAGDTVEDSVTYVDMPDHFSQHLEGLAALRALDPVAVLPNHGDPEVIAGGGYRGAGLIDTTESYIKLLRRSVGEPELRARPLREWLEGGGARYFAAYEEVHAHNLRVVVDR